jgi:MFS family permease
MNLPFRQFTGTSPSKRDGANSVLPRGLEITLLTLAYPGLYGIAIPAASHHPWLVALTFFFSFLPVLPFEEYEPRGSRLRIWSFDAAEFSLTCACFAAWVYPLARPFLHTVGRAAGWALLSTICITLASLLAARIFGRKRSPQKLTSGTSLQIAVVAGPLLGVFIAGMLMGDLLFALYVADFFGLELPLFLPPFWVFICGAIVGLAYYLRAFWKSI